MNVRLEEVSDWLYFSTEDLQSAELLLKEGIFSQACFHAQQCAEKALKAFVVFRNGSVKKIHDLNELLDLCYSFGGDDLRAFEAQINFLTKFYTPTRYPDAAPGVLKDRLPNKKDAAEAVAIADAVYAAVNKMIVL